MLDMNRSVMVLKDFFKFFVEGWIIFFWFGSKFFVKKIFLWSKKFRGNFFKFFEFFIYF